MCAGLATEGGLGRLGVGCVEGGGSGFSGMNHTMAHTLRTALGGPLTSHGAFLKI